MFYKYVKCGILTALLLLCIWLLTACDAANAASSHAQSGPTGAATTAGVASVTPTQGKTTTSDTNVTVTPVQSNGAAPVELGSPTAVPGGSASSQQVMLKDRTLVIENASKQKGANPDPVAINITLTIKNTGGKAIQNQASFFQLVGTGGDFFGQVNSSDNFYGPITAHTTRSGTITFQLPSAAVTNLRLMYRSEVASGALLIPLKLQ